MAGTNVSLMICELMVAVTTVAPAGRGTRLVDTVGFALDFSELVPVVATIPSSVLRAAEVGFGVGNISGLVELLDSGDIEGSEVPALKSPVPKLSNLLCGCWKKQKKPPQTQTTKWWHFE